MILGVDDNSIILALVGFVQIIVVGLGAWMLVTLVKLNATMAALNVTMKQLQVTSDEYYEYRRWSEGKIKAMWEDYQARRHRERGSGGELPALGDGP